MLTEKTHCGFIALIGRPNVGKSTLMNRLIGQKISITSRKPQTTRHRIAGILTEENNQFVFVDTPGLHRKTPFEMNRIMNKTALSVLREVDVVVWMVDAGKWTEQDEWIMTKLMLSVSVPIILALNKVDKVKEKDTLLPEIEKFYQTHYFKAVVPISARASENLSGLLQEIKKYLPENPFFYTHDEVTDRSVRFLCAEMIREKIMRYTGDEVPYALTIEIEKYEIKNRLLSKLAVGSEVREDAERRTGVYTEDSSTASTKPFADAVAFGKKSNDIVHIHALIWVEKDSQKAIVIGEKGEMLKKVGQEARLDMEAMLGQKVFLKLWCKVKSGWSDDARALQSLGYGNESS